MMDHGHNDRVNVSGDKLMKEGGGKREGSGDGKSFIYGQTRGILA